MHFTKFFSVVERDLDILNPVSHEKLMLLADYCDVRDGSRVLDIGSGKGYLLREWVKRRSIEGTGLEINPSFVAEARGRASTEDVGDALTFVKATPSGSSRTRELRHVTCLGAPFAIGASMRPWRGCSAPEALRRPAIGTMPPASHRPEDVARREE